MRKNLAAQTPSLLIYSSPLFTLSMVQSQKNTRLQMQLLVPHVNTRYFPQTMTFLETNYPNVFRTECFNEKNLPFTVEAKATEIGHLFEHIVLEEMVSLKVAAGEYDAVFNGRTDWNWKRDPEGLFHILLDVGKKELALLIQALGKAIHLIESLMSGVIVEQRALSLTV